jgi:zinc transporter 2
MSANVKEPLVLVSKDAKGVNISFEHFERDSQAISARNEGKLETQDKLKKLILFSLTFMIVELIGGYISNSIAVISDALHMFTDFLGYIVQFYSAYLAVQKRTGSFTFGYSRAESLGGLFNCFLIWAITAYLLYEAVDRFIRPPKHFQPGVMLLTAFLGVLLNLCMGGILVGFSNIKRIVVFWGEYSGNVDNKAEDFNLKSTIMHIRGDMVYSVGVLISAILINLFPQVRFFDSVCTILFSYVVLDITRPIFSAAVRYILEGVPEGTITRFQRRRVT